MKYSLEDFENCVITEYKLSDTILDKINVLTSKLGINNVEIKRSNRRARSEQKNELWEKVKPAMDFKKTVMEEKTGIDKLLSGIKISLNKLNVQNYDKEKEIVVSSIDELKKETHDVREDILSIFINTSQLNPFYSKFYVKMLCEILNDDPRMHEIFLNNDIISVYKESLSKIEYIDSNEDFNKHCMINKENDKRKGLCVFLIELVKQEFYDEEILFELFNYQVELLEKHENDKCNVHINDEIVENIVSLFKEGIEIMKSQDYFNNIEDKVKKCKDKKANEGISKRAIFKFMDICDSF